MDKDGTLIYFTKDWVTMVQTFILQFTEIKKMQEIMVDMGHVEGELVENGLLSSASTKEIVRLLALQLGYEEENLLKSFRHFQLMSVKTGKISIEPVPKLVETLARLKQQNIFLGIATADDYETTLFTIEKLNISKYIDFIGTSDHFLAKPNREMLDCFCEKFQLNHEEVVHIGDTSVDMEFASASLAGIGVLSGNGTEQELKRYTSYIIESFQDVVHLLPKVEETCK